jgi:hypothetical protein
MNLYMDSNSQILLSHSQQGLISSYNKIKYNLIVILLVLWLIAANNCADRDGSRDLLIGLYTQSFFIRCFDVGTIKRLFCDLFLKNRHL